jgi:hypothetical protein
MEKYRELDRNKTYAKTFVAATMRLLFFGMYNESNNKITELRTILQRESQNS